MKKKTLKRKSLTKKVRFDVFKRDSFTCQYCGNAPPTAVLEVDHIHPVSKAGSTLDQSPETIIQKKLILEEKEDQIKAFNQLQSRKKSRQKRAVTEIEKEFQVYFPESQLTETFKRSVKMFLGMLAKHDVLEAMGIAGEKHKDAHSTTKYFCGICWNKIKAKQ